MKKVLIIFVCVLMSPIVSYAACLQAQSGEFEFSECLFQGQNFTSAAKSFWGDPKVDSSVALSNKGDTKDFVLYSAYQCGYCTLKVKDPLHPLDSMVVNFSRPDDPKK